MSWTLRIPLLIDELGLQALHEDLSITFPNISIRCGCNNGWHYTATEISDALSSKHYGNHYLESIVFLSDERELLKLSNQEEAVRIDLPDDKQDLNQKLIDRIRKYKSPFSYWVGMPLWNVANLCFFLPAAIGSLTGMFIRHPVETFESFKSSPGPSNSLGPILLAITKPMLIFFATLAILGLALRPFRGLYRYVFPHLSLDVLANKNKNDIAKWARRLLYATAVGVFAKSFMN